MFLVVIHSSVVADPFVTAVYYHVWERITRPCILSGIMKFVCLYRAGVYSEYVLLWAQCVVFVTVTQFFKCVLEVNMGFKIMFT